MLQINARTRWIVNPLPDGRAEIRRTVTDEYGHADHSELIGTCATVLAAREEVSRRTPARVCDYCEEAPATGYVPAYGAHVCESCYVDHHGPIDL